MSTKTKSNKRVPHSVIPTRGLRQEWGLAHPRHENEATTSADRLSDATPEASGSAHDFGQIRVRPGQGDRTQVARQVPDWCPLGLSTPTACPFGGACHGRPTAVQAKLTIGQPNDRYEQEADRAAEQVLRMPEPSMQRSCLDCEEDSIQDKPLGDQITPLAQRQVEPEEKEEKTIQTQRVCEPRPQVSPDLGARIRSLRGRGQPLPASERAFFEPRFGRDFSYVRVHTDAEAAESARSLNSQAYTTGRDIVFGSGHYAPGSGSGMKLLAHELTHVVQQGSAGHPCRVQLEAEEQNTYVVQEGESLTDIADRFGVTVEDLVAANPPPKLKTWTTPSGRKIKGFDAGDTIVVPPARAPVEERATGGSRWEYVKEMAKGVALPLERAWSLLSGWVSEEEAVSEEATAWTPCVMPGPVEGGPEKKSNMDASFVDKLNNICGRMKAQGYDTKIFWGYRTEAEQVHIATAGRSFVEFKTFMDSEVEEGHITEESAQVYIDYYDPNKGNHAMRQDEDKATWTLKSVHRIGKAADVVHPTALWNPPEGEAYWDALEAAAEGEGLRIGPPASDRAHVQVP